MLVIPKLNPYKTLRAIYIDDNNNVIVDGEKISQDQFKSDYIELSTIVKQYKDENNLGTKVTKKFVNGLSVSLYGSVRVITLMLKDRKVIIARAYTSADVKKIVHSVLNATDEDLSDVVEMYDIRVAPNGIPIVLPK